jgi:hypothetical protein
VQARRGARIKTDFTLLGCERPARPAVGIESQIFIQKGYYVFFFFL